MSLGTSGIGDFLEIATVGSDASFNVDIVVLLDRIPGYDVTHDDWTGARFGLINNGDTPTAVWGTDWGPAGMGYLSEPNMADPQTVVNFVTEAAAAYPSTNYALILWDHGNGWRSRKDDEKKDRPVKAICWDDTDGDGFGLDINELQTALANMAGLHINVIGFDACHMAMLEVAYEIRTFGDVMVGSEEDAPDTGWPYDTILANLVAAPGMDAAALGTVIVNQCDTAYSNSEMQMAIDLTEIANVITQTDTLAALLIADHTIEAPIKAAAANVMTAITTAVISEKHGTAWPGTHGLAIYFPSVVGSYNSDYETAIDFSGATQWDEFLADYYVTMSGTWVETVRGNSQSYANPAFIDLYDFCTRLNSYTPDDPDDPPADPDDPPADPDGNGGMQRVGGSGGGGCFIATTWQHR